MNILVLGGDGFLGSHLVDQLVPLGHNVTVFDRFPYAISRNLEHQRGRIHFISGEFANRDDLNSALEGQDILYHLVCATNPAESWNDPLMEIEGNLRTSITLCETASHRGIKKIVFPSSGGTIYGIQVEPVDENAVPRPLAPYGITKLAVEYFLHYFLERHGIAYDIYRIGNPYGPRQPTLRPQGVMAVWMRDILAGKEIQVYGDHDTLRDYVYIGDAAYLMTHSLKDLSASDTFNLGSGAGISILQLLQLFRDVIDIPFQYRIHPRRSSDNASIVLNSAKLLSFFPGFKFQDLEKKLGETWNYFKTAFHTTC